MIKVFENHSDSQKSQEKYDLPSAAILIHNNAAEANQRNAPWHVVVERDSEAEDYAKIIDAMLKDHNTKNLATNYVMRSLVFDSVNTDSFSEKITEKEVDPNKIFDRKTLEKYQNAALILLYELGDNLMETLHTAKEVYGNTDLSFFMFKYVLRDVKDPKTDKPAKMPGVECTMHTLTAENNSFDNIKPITKRPSFPADSVHFRALMLHSLIYANAYDKEKTETLRTNMK